MEIHTPCSVTYRWGYKLIVQWHNHSMMFYSICSVTYWWGSILLVQWHIGVFHTPCLVTYWWRSRLLALWHINKVPYSLFSDISIGFHTHYSVTVMGLHTSWCFMLIFQFHAYWAIKFEKLEIEAVDFTLHIKYFIYFHI